MPSPMTKTSPFDRLLRSTAFKESTPDEKLKLMLEHKGLHELLAGGWLLDVQTLAKKVGYTPQHVRVLCREEKIPCVKRGYGAASAIAEEEFQYFFLPEVVKALFKYQRARA